MNTTKLILATLIIAAFGIAGCGGTEEQLEAEDEANIRAACPAPIQGQVMQAEMMQMNAEASAGDAMMVEPAEPMPRGGECFGNNGYCCNTSTGNVSKTSAAGCDYTWYANLAGCLTDPVCGSPSQNCYIN